MRSNPTLFMVLSTALCLGGSAVLAAPQPIVRASDIVKSPTARAIVTVSQARGDIRAMIFGNVHSLNSCLGLAVAATKQGWKESSATCLDTRGRAIASYFCRKQGEVKCQAGIPSL